MLSADLDRVLEAGDDEIGWLAKTGRLALGYLGDAAKTARTYPVVDGVRYAVPGDRARLLDGGVVELHGRDSVTINSGGEKIFAEEVEAAIKAHPERVRLRRGRPTERAVGQRGRRDRSDPRRLRGRRRVAACSEAERHIARYKLPKSIVYVDEVMRSPSGKADYRWAKQVAARTP